jgi:hypothetical protein
MILPYLSLSPASAVPHPRTPVGGGVRQGGAGLCRTGAEPQVRQYGKEKKPMDRPLGYIPELAEKILQRIMDGEMLTTICTESDMPSWQAYYRWLDGRPDLHARARLAWLINNPIPCD